MLKDRLVSLDVFRGATIAAMILVNDPGSWQYVYPPLRHAEWHGWTFTDLIFPFFLFIVGVAIVFAFSRRLEQNVPQIELYKKIIRRTLILFALGLFLNGFPFFNLSTLRIMGVLQRIAVCYFFASVVFLHMRFPTPFGVAVALLFIYWALMEWIPVPGIGAGVYEKGANFAAYIDSLILKGHMWKYTKTWDPEGIISTLPAISTTLFGVLTGHLLRSKKERVEKTALMLIYGNLALLIGSIWNVWLPINKNLWTSSYSVFMAGMAMITLGIIYYIVDVKGYRKGTRPFVIYGMNAIAVYVLSGIVAKTTIIIKVASPSGEPISLKTWIYENIFLPLLGPLNGSFPFETTRKLLQDFLPRLMEFPPFRLLNLNIPGVPPEDLRGLRVVRLGSRVYEDPVEPVGENRFQIGGSPRWTPQEGTDLWAIERGYASLTPLTLDLTDHDGLSLFQTLRL